MNTGLDPICEVSNIIGKSGSPQIARYLIQFDNNEIQDIVNNRINGNPYNVSLKGFIALAQGINADTSLEVYPLAQSWNNGTGQYLDSPETMDGASWVSPFYSGSGIWNLSGSLNGYSYTGSYNPNYSQLGGGSWFYNNINGIYVTASYVFPGYVGATSLLTPSQSYGLRTVKDIDINVDNIVDTWFNDLIPNNGFIVKLSDPFEFNPSQYVQPILKYFSVDTNTIYPPYLEFKWDDSITVLTGSLTGSIVDTTNLKVALNENPGIFYPSSVNRFRVDVSPLYPPRVYQTSSLFTNLYFLPTSSYYAIKDLDTNEYVINFDEQCTKISSDAKGNYFDVYMSGLEPERYYSVLIKTIINGSTIIFDDQYYFKVVNG